VSLRTVGVRGERNIKDDITSIHHLGATGVELARGRLRFQYCAKYWRITSLLWPSLFTPPDSDTVVICRICVTESMSSGYNEPFYIVFSKVAAQPDVIHKKRLRRCLVICKQLILIEETRPY
jgi:hypothetical protein